MQFGCKECNKMAFETIKFTTIGVFCGWGCYKEFRRKHESNEIVKSICGKRLDNAI